MVEFLFFIILFAIIFNILWYSWRYGITPTPTTGKVKKEIIRHLPQLHSGKNVYELGSGWGTMAFQLAQYYPYCEIQAFEKSPIPFVFSKLVYKKNNLHIIRKDFFSISLADASLIYCYLYPGAMEDLKEKFEKELKANTYVITHTFAIPGWQAFQVIKANDLYQTPIFFYRIK